MSLPKQMREARVAIPVHLTKEGWYYISPRMIEVFAESDQGPTTCVRLTRRQLEQVLAIMDKHAET